MLCAAGDLAGLVLDDTFRYAYGRACGNEVVG